MPCFTASEGRVGLWALFSVSGQKFDERATKHLRNSLQVLFYIDPGHGRGSPVLRRAPERADHIDISNEKE